MIYYLNSGSTVSCTVYNISIPFSTINIIIHIPLYLYSGQFNDYVTGNPQISVRRTIASNFNIAGYYRQDAGNFNFFGQTTLSVGTASLSALTQLKGNIQTFNCSAFLSNDGMYPLMQDMFSGYTFNNGHYTFKDDQSRGNLRPLPGSPFVLMTIADDYFNSFTIEIQPLGPGYRVKITKDT